jgi:anti-anti-sigma factor
MPELPEPFFAKCISRSDQVVLKLGGECDAATLEQLNDALREAVAERQKDVIVDLARVTFIESMTLGALTAAAKQVRGRGRSFSVMCVASPEVRRAFEITGLDDYLLVTLPGRS